MVGKVTKQRANGLDQICWLSGADGTCIWSSRGYELADDTEPMVRVYVPERTKMPSQDR